MDMTRLSLARWLSRSCLLACCYAPRHAAELLRRVPPVLPPFSGHTLVIPSLSHDANIAVSVTATALNSWVDVDEEE